VKTLVVVQARVGSTRLPGKVLLPLGGRTMLERMLERLLAARTPDALMVATTTDPADDPIVQASAAAGVPCFRGHPTDLLDRHYAAARQAGADVVVKVPSDCPLIDPAVVDRVLGEHLARCDRVDYTSNLHPESYPDGSDVEVMSTAALEAAWRDARRPYEREHTTPFLWDQPERYRLHNVLWESGRDASRTHRIVVDYPEDHAVVQAIHDALWTAAHPIFHVGEIVSFLDAHREVLAMNAARRGTNWYRLHQGELRTVGAERSAQP
jgi:spore coat polysaccharide biosynthesis protein SpsF